MFRLYRKRVWLAATVLVIAFVGWRANERFAMPDVQPHVGDGRFENHSWRFPWAHFGMPIPGYIIDFGKFELANAFDATYRVERLPSIDNDLGIYLSIIDLGGKFRNDESRKLLNAKVEISIVDQRGEIVCHIEEPLAKMVWADPEGGPDTYGLYDLDHSFFIPEKDGQCQIHVRYWPDPKLSGLRGFFHIRCGGSI